MTHDPTPRPARPATAAEKRQARIDRWSRPLVTRWDRIRAWTNMIFVDHAFFRLAYLNLHRLSPNAWRSAQPLPYQITRLARQGLRTVVTLRGGQTFGSLPLEREVCERHGLKFERFKLFSRALPSVDEILGAKALFERLEYPVLFHCKSGADRAGMMSALFLILYEGRPVAEARQQLSLRYGHVRTGKTGILDALFDAYEADQPDAALPFLEWVTTRYDPKAIGAAFKEGRLGAFLTDKVLKRE